MKTLGRRPLIVALGLIALVYILVSGGQFVAPASAQQDEISRLKQQIQKLYEEGHYSEAVPLARQALALQENSLGPDHPDVATSLNILGFLYEEGRNADAEPLYKRSLAIREKALGPDHPDVATSLNNLGLLYDNQGRYTDAEPLLKRALEINEKVFGSNHPAVALSLNTLAFLYGHQSRYADAELLSKRSLEIREKTLGLDHPDVAQSLNNLAGIYVGQGRYADAEPLFKRALTISDKTLGPNHPSIAMLLNNLGVLYDDQGRYTDAESFYKRALEIREKAFGPDHPDVANSLNNLAEFYRVQRRYEDAWPLYGRALEIYGKAPERNLRETAVLLNNLALLNGDQGRYTDAENLQKHALDLSEKVLGPDHPNVALALNNLAELYRNQGRYADAEQSQKRSLAIYEKALGPNHPNVAMLLNNLGYVYKSQRRYTDAEPLFKRSLAIFEEALGPDHPNVAGPLNNLAELYGDQGRYADALPLIHRTIVQGVANSVVAFPILFQSQNQHLISAASSFDDSYNTIQRSSLSAVAKAITKLAARFAAGSGQLSELVRQDQDLTAEDQGLDKLLIGTVSKPPAERNPVAEEQIRKRIETIKSERNKLHEIFNQRFPDYVALSHPQSLPLKETQALLADDEALVVFYFDVKSYAWIITRTNADWAELNISTKDLDAQVIKLRQSLVFDESKQEPKPLETQLAYKLYQETFGVFADKIASKKRISVITNGALTSLPLHLLVTKDPSGKQLKDVDWLVRSYAITILPSVASLKVLRGAAVIASAQKPMIAFADPVFSKTMHQQANPHKNTNVAMRGLVKFATGTRLDIRALAQYLENRPIFSTREEVQSIAKVLQVNANDLHFGLDATETAVKNARLDQYRIVYFATHGLVAGDLEDLAKAKIEPSLAFSFPDNATDIDDGLLTASEVAELKLNADWVVLSACNTAAEEKPGAEALSGLARAFFYAGARSLLVSYWNIDDEATASLMTGVFIQMKNNPKLSHGEALRQSMLAMINNVKTEHPYFWAPFVVIGEPTKPN